LDREENADIVVPDVQDQVHHEPNFTRPVTRASWGILKLNLKYVLSAVGTKPIPSNISQALNNLEWKQAMEEEYGALMRNKTWSMVPRPNNMNIVGSKWVFKVKEKVDGTIEQLKAYLIAKGFTQ
jgi:histone deacetylase 1/2